MEIAHVSNRRLKKFKLMYTQVKKRYNKKVFWHQSCIFLVIIISVKSR